MVTPLKLCHELNLGYENIAIGIAAGYLFNYDEDNKAQEIQNGIKANGIRNTIAKISGLSEDSKLTDMIVKKYEELKICFN
ncbi:MAG: hypothetical protein ACFWTK_04200 [Clostridium sp.]